MSYSFHVKAATKAAAIAAVAAKLDEIAVQQPVHEADKVQALAAAESFVRILADDDEKNVCVNVSGSVSYVHVEAGQPQITTSADVSVSAGLLARPVEKTED